MFLLQGDPKWSLGSGWAFKGPFGQAKLKGLFKIVDNSLKPYGYM